MVRKYSRRRFGDLEVQGRNVVHVATGVAVAGDDFSVKLTLEKFMDQSWAASWAGLGCVLVCGA